MSSMSAAVLLLACAAVTLSTPLIDIALQDHLLFHGGLFIGGYDLFIVGGPQANGMPQTQPTQSPAQSSAQTRPRPGPEPSHSARAVTESRPQQVFHPLLLGVPSLFNTASVVSGLIHVAASMCILLRGGWSGAPGPIPGFFRPCPASQSSAPPHSCE